MNEERFFTATFIQCKIHINKLRNAVDTSKMFISRTHGDFGEKRLAKNKTN
jgi:hypothetical protein